MRPKPHFILAHFLSTHFFSGLNPAVKNGSFLSVSFGEREGGARTNLCASFSSTPKSGFRFSGCLGLFTFFSQVSGFCKGLRLRFCARVKTHFLNLGLERPEAQNKTQGHQPTSLSLLLLLRKNINFGGGGGGGSKLSIAGNIVPLCVRVSPQSSAHDFPLFPLSQRGSFLLPSFHKQPFIVGRGQQGKPVGMHACNVRPYPKTRHEF